MLILLVILILISLILFLYFKKSKYSKIADSKVKKILKNKKFEETKENIPIIPIIPNVIHKIYIDSTGTLDNLDKSVLDLFEKVKKDNPDYTLKVWSGNEARNYLSQNFDLSYLTCYDNLIPYAYKADFFRYCLIYNEGGWYSDLKEEILIKLNELKGYTFIGIVDLGNDYCLKNICLQNAFFAAIPKHPVLDNCAKACIMNYKNKFYGESYLDPTGPRLFGKCFEETIVIPKKVLFGYYLYDPDGGYHFMDNKKVVIHKCKKCKKGNDWTYGNNFIELWKNKNIYKM
jgi:mannosyltransferase OCH1-like enzyme